jgi:exoribonuclease R
MEKIPGILILNDNRTYGRSTTNNRLLYRCIPNDKTLSPVLVPYKINLGFSKVMKNLYILFSIREKTATLVETIGEIDILENFYEYQLYCRNLKHKQPSFSLYSEILTELKREKNPFIFTIDSPGTIDFDDAFSVESINETHVKINIYIANVPFILSKYNLLHHFHFFQERVASIYLPNKKIPLFPTKLSELCSLTAGQERPSFVLSLYINKNTHQISHHEFHCEIIYISANYVYESADLLSNTNYIQLLDLTQSTFKKDIQKSDELVETLMIFMGSTCAKQMDNGIYLLQTPIQSMATLSISSISSTYVLEKPEIPYMHITSPIRRIIDIVNMAQLILTLEIEPPDFSLELQQQIDHVKENLLNINNTMKSIKKVQSQCRLYHLFKHQPQNKTYSGILFDKRETKTPEIYSYSVYLTEYKFTTTIKTREPKEPGNECRFYLYLFHDATTLKQKIKLQIAGLC